MSQPCCKTTHIVPFRTFNRTFLQKTDEVGNKAKFYTSLSHVTWLLFVHDQCAINHPYLQ